MERRRRRKEERDVVKQEVVIGVKENQLRASSIRRSRMRRKLN